jgi:hypothetical protein
MIVLRLLRLARLLFFLGPDSYIVFAGLRAFLSGRLLRVLPEGTARFEPALFLSLLSMPHLLSGIIITTFSLYVINNLPAPELFKPYTS